MCPTKYNLPKLERKWERKGEKKVSRVFSLCAQQNIISPNRRENGRENGREKSHVFWTEILTSKTFLFFPLLSISSFIFCLFLLLLIHFSALYFVCSSLFLSYDFFLYIHFFSSFVLHYCVCEVSIHTQLN